LQKNDQIVQDGNTNAMLWKINELIAYVSQFFTLKKGDILFTGTPEGVGKVSENDVLTGTINGVESFKINVK
jgi:2-keto-4-pentenoate hydratase/2-oxohepta-3-ene-1,7-dioic acid hydratase in catechol pathway